MGTPDISDKRRIELVNEVSQLVLDLRNVTLISLAANARILGLERQRDALLYENRQLLYGPHVCSWCKQLFPTMEAVQGHVKTCLKNVLVQRITALEAEVETLRTPMPTPVDKYPGVQAWESIRYGNMICGEVRGGDGKRHYFGGGGQYDGIVHEALFSKELTGQDRINLIERALNVKPDLLDVPRWSPVVLFEYIRAAHRHVWALRSDKAANALGTFTEDSTPWTRRYLYPYTSGEYAKQYPDERRMSPDETRAYLQKHPLPTAWLAEGK
jgi:hypothetical protein